MIQKHLEDPGMLKGIHCPGYKEPESGDEFGFCDEDLFIQLRDIPRIEKSKTTNNFKEHRLVIIEDNVYEFPLRKHTSVSIHFRSELVNNCINFVRSMIISFNFY